MGKIITSSLPIDPVTEYAAKVVSGEYMAGEFVKLACRRHIMDLGRDELFFNADEASRIIQFFPECLRHYKGEWAGQKFILNPWQEFVIGSLYGWYKVGTDRRRYRTAYVETGKGSGKTPIASGMALYHTLADNQPEAQGYFIASNGDQALIAMQDAVKMVRANPQLDQVFRVVGGEVRPDMLLRKGEGSFIQRKTTPPSGRGSSGFSVSFLLVDEYHEHLESDTYDLYAAGVKARKSPLVLIITNAGTETTSPCGIEHDYAIQVVRRAIGGEPAVHDAYFSFVCNLDKDDDIQDRTLWPKTNPSLPGPPGYEYVEEELNRMLRQGKKHTAERLLFCKWQNSVSGWLHPDDWKNVEVEGVEAEELKKLITKETPCYICFDLGFTKDFSAGNLIWDLSTPEKERYVAELTVWTPRDTLVERAQKDRAPYMQWVEEGYLIALPGSVMDFDPMVEWVLDAHQKYNVVGMTYDPHKSKFIKRGLEKAGMFLCDNWLHSGFLVVAHPQGLHPNRRDKVTEKPGECYLWMNSSMSEVERWVYEGHLRFFHNPLMNLAVAGSAVLEDKKGSNRYLEKYSKQHSRIDPLVALTMGVGFVKELKDTKFKDVNSGEGNLQLVY